MQTETRNKRREILLVEDNPGDVDLASESLEDAHLCHLSVVQNGEDALTFLRRRGGYVNAPRPDIMFLDLNLPRQDGRELLADIKGDPELRQIPIIVLTTSSREMDIARSYDLHANCYVIKPVGIEQLIRVIRSTTEFWFSVAALPPTLDRS